MILLPDINLLFLEYQINVLGEPEVEVDEGGHGDGNRRECAREDVVTEVKFPERGQGLETAGNGAGEAVRVEVEEGQVGEYGKVF